VDIYSQTCAVDVVVIGSQADLTTVSVTRLVGEITSLSAS